MASFTLSAGNVFPPTTTLNLYAGTAPATGTAPAGTSLDSGTLGTDGEITFGGLDAGAQYYVSAQVDSVWRHVSFTAEEDAATGVEVEEELSLFGTAHEVLSTGTIQAAVDQAQAGDTIYVEPGEYDEAVTIPRALSNLTLVGVGGRGAVMVAPSATNATALTIEADDVTVRNIGCDGDGTGSGLVNRGRRTRVEESKIEGGAVGLKLTLGTAAQIAAGTHGKGDDVWIVDCEICWNTKGVELVCTDYGAVTQVRFRGCTFHDNTAADFEESNGSGGSTSVRYRDLDIGDCVFLRQEDGTEPTAYILLNDDNGNKGVVHGCVFPSALAGGKNLVSTGLIWAGNFHTGGISTGQPS